MPTPTAANQCAYLGVNAAGAYAFRPMLNTCNGYYAQHNGFSMWNFDPLLANEAYFTTSGALYLSKIALGCPALLSSVRLGIGSPGSNLTPGQNFIGIYNSAYELIGSTADLSAQLNDLTGALSAELTAPVTVAAETIYVALLTNGANLPGFFEAPRLNADHFMQQFRAEPRFALLSGPLSALPATIDSTSLIRGTHCLWVGL